MPIDIKPEIDKFSQGGNLIVSFLLENYQDNLVKIIEYLVNQKNFSGVLVAANRPGEHLNRIFQQNKIKVENIVYVDTVTSFQEKREGNFVFLVKPFTATLVSIVLDSYINDEKYKFFIFDTLDAIMLRDSMTIVKFFQFVLPKLATKGKIGLLFGVSLDMNNKETKLIATACDKVLRE